MTEKTSQIGKSFEELKRRKSIIPAMKSASNEPEPSIAVLPFVDMSPDKDQDHFCEGMAQLDWITHDSDLDNLREHPRFKALLPAG